MVALAHYLREYPEVSLTLLAWLNGGLLVAVFILAIHDQQTIATLKRQHGRIKALEASHEAAVRAQADQDAKDAEALLGTGRVEGEYMSAFPHFPLTNVAPK
jgi:hypothetical protein